MKNIKRLLSLALALTLVFSLCAPVLAEENSKRYEPYKYYMCVGDSIASGCSLTKDGSETVFNQETDDYTTVYNPDYIYYGYDYAAVPTAYHSIVANALDCRLLQYARSGLRAVEFRYFLEGVYNDYDETRSWGNTYFDNDSNGFTLDDLDAMNDAVNYVEAVKKTNVISINVGSNDVFSFTLGVVLAEMTASTTDARLMEIGEFLDNGGSVSAAFGKLVEYCKLMGQLPKLAALISTTFYKAYDQFVENYDAVIEKIYEYNPDVTIVAVGVFNPFEHFRLQEGSALDLSGLARPIVLAINNHLKALARENDNFVYADVVGTETYDMSYNDRYFWEYFTLKVHPTLAGHEFMAQQILSSLPERGTLPFADVPADAWYYDELYYAWFNGLVKGTSEKEYSPDAQSTRAQAVTMLYRLAGEPDTGGMSENFADVDDDFWGRNAIIWAYNAKIVTGYTPTVFGPDDAVTRAEFVTMLHRCFGSPAAEADLGVFKDADSIESCYLAAVKWAYSNGIINGFEDSTLCPNDGIDRAQLAAVLARCDKNL